MSEKVEPLKQELEQRLLSYMDVLEQAVEMSVDVGAEQVPLIVQELISWKLAEACFYTLISSFCLFICLFAIVKIGRSSWKKWKDLEMVALSCVTPTIPIIILMICFLTSLTNILQLYFTPRIYLLEYIKEFLA